MERKLKPCPFCGHAPITYIGLFEGCALGYPVLSALIKCERCGFAISRSIEYDQASGRTEFESIDRDMDRIVAQWNERAILGKQFTADEVAYILVETGQNDKNKFELGDRIQYSPSEVKNILSNWKGSEET